MSNQNLAERILESSVVHGDFVLSSGRRSTYYVDKYLFLCRPDLLSEIAAELVSRLPAGVDRIAGVEGGATILATAMGLEAGIPFLIVRKGRKGYGLDKWCEGDWEPGMQVVLVEDIVTTGAQVGAAAEALVSGGLELAGILCVVDRGGVEALLSRGFKAEAVAALSQDDVAASS